jgi:hypothetical protein
MSFRKLVDRRVASPLLAILLCVCVQAAIAQDSDKTWEDSSTGLMWTVEDNGNDFNWNQANAYCEGLTLGGYSDWRLPTIDELEGLYDRTLKKQYKAKGPIDLQSANIWSGSKNSLGDSWIFNFGYGGSNIASGSGGCGTVGRALCARKAESK